MAQFKVGDRVRAIRGCDGTVEKGGIWVGSKLIEFKGEA